MEKDLHYFVTRIINPDLNWIVVSMQSNRRVVHGRDGYTRVNWTDKSPLDEVADRLTEWRDNLYYGYQRDFPANGKEILEGYFKILLDVELLLHDDSDSKVLAGLWELAESMGDFLGLSEYVNERKQAIKDIVILRKSQNPAGEKPDKLKNEDTQSNSEGNTGKTRKRGSRRSRTLNLLKWIKKQ
jgi:hypothetical protein